MSQNTNTGYDVVCPLQYFGIGDIIFTQTLIRAIAGSKPVVWGVLPQFVDGLQRAYPETAWVDYRSSGIDYNIQSDCIIDNKRLIPIRWADTLLGLPYSRCMAAKYDLYKLDWQFWKEAAMWEHDRENESRLFNLVVKDDSPYNLVNNVFGSNNQLRVNIKPNNGLRNVEMRTISGFSIFDWAGIIENATEIHTVSTSIVYILELMPINSPIHLYPRIPVEPDFRNVDYILNTHKYTMHL